MICPYWRESIGRPRSKSCIVLVQFIDSCKIIGEGILLPVAMDGMDGNGLKLEKIGQFFQVLMLCVPKSSRNLLW